MKFALLVLAMLQMVTGFSPHSTTSCWARRSTLLRAKEVDEEPPPVRLEAIGSIAEFGKQNYYPAAELAGPSPLTSPPTDDGKHDRPLLGVIKGAISKAKGGTNYEIVTSENKVGSLVPRTYTIPRPTPINARLSGVFDSWAKHPFCRERWKRESEGAGGCARRLCCDPQEETDRLVKLRTDTT